MVFNRRDFLRRSAQAALGGASMFGPLGNLGLISAAAALNRAQFNDYKALVCLFLLGGNDSFNTIVPTDAIHYSLYAAQRNALAVAQASVLPLTPLAGGGPSDGGQYGVHPSCPEFAQLFNSGHAAIVANVGTLLRPTTKAQYQSGTYVLPPNLFAHNDQQRYWQTSRPDDDNADGWGGRIADLLYASNPNPQVPTTISIAQQSLFQRGASVNQYVTDASGITQIGFVNSGQTAALSVFDALRQPGMQAHAMQRTYAADTDHALKTYSAIAAALPVLQSPPQAPYAAFPQTYVGTMLQTVARLLSANASLDMRRQIFFVGIGGYDTHASQLSQQSALLADLAQSTKALYDATAFLGMQDSVTIFTASDFGRTLSINGDGTDHGWGGHHFVVGGAVKGQRFYGTMPSLQPSAQNPDDAGWGQIIPTTSVDQYAATLAQWFGVDATGIGTIFPNLANFSGTLGFMG